MTTEHQELINTLSDGEKEKIADIAVQILIAEISRGLFAVNTDKCMERALNFYAEFKETFHADNLWKRE